MATDIARYATGPHRAVPAYALAGSCDTPAPDAHPGSSHPGCLSGYCNPTQEGSYAYPEAVVQPARDIH